MGANSRERSKQERSGDALNKEDHVTEYKPNRQAKQTIQSKKNTEVGTIKKQKQGSSRYTMKQEKENSSSYLYR